VLFIRLARCGPGAAALLLHTFGLSFHDVLALGDAVEGEPQGRPDHG
jgi:hypothetical protein